MANDDMILSFIEGDKKLELSIKGYEFDEYFKQIKGEFDTSDQDSEWLMIKAVFSECGKQIECYDPSLKVCDLKYLSEQLTLVIKNSEKYLVVEFTEPNIVFKFTQTGGGYSVWVRFWDEKRKRKYAVTQFFSLQELGIESIPINVLIPIKGTPLQNQRPLSEDDIIRTIVIFRYINPTAYIRLAGGRALMQDSGRHAFHSGANAAITGNMLTTSGNNIKQDLEMLSDEGFDILREIKV